ASCMLCTGRMNRSRKCISLHDALPILKMKDKYARTSDITKKDKSVLTGRTIKQVEKAADNVWQSNRTNGQETKKKRSATQSKKQDRKSTRLNSSHVKISYTVFCLKKKT